MRFPNLSRATRAGKEDCKSARYLTTSYRKDPLPADFVVGANAGTQPSVMTNHGQKGGMRVPVQAPKPPTPAPNAVDGSDKWSNFQLKALVKVHREDAARPGTQASMRTEEEKWDDIRRALKEELHEGSDDSFA